MEEKNLVPQEELQENAQNELEPQNVEKESAGPFGLIVSALFGPNFTCDCYIE